MSAVPPEAGPEDLARVVLESSGTDIPKANILICRRKGNIGYIFAEDNEEAVKIAKGLRDRNKKRKGEVPSFLPEICPDPDVATEEIEVIKLNLDL